MAPVKPAVKPTNGKPTNGTSAPSVGMVEMGRTGLRQFYGRIDEEFLVELKWENAVKIYREMSENDPTIGSLLNAITLLTRQVTWRFTSEIQNDPRADFLDSCRKDMQHAWDDLLAEVVRGVLTYGWQAHEIVYKRRVQGQSQFNDGLIGWKKLPVRAQDTLFRWDYDEATQELKAMIQRPAPDYKERRLPMDKLLLFRTESFKDNPEGRSVLRSAYRPWYFKKHLENIEAIGLERKLAGLPIVWGPARLFDGTASGEDLTTRTYLEKMATGIRKDEQWGVGMPLAYDEHGNKLFDLTLLATGGESEVDTSKAIERYDLRILQLMLADFIQVGHDSQGSRALASTKTNIFLVSIGIVLQQVASTFNRDAVPAILELNGMDLEDPPQLKPSDLEARNLTELSDYVQKLSAAGMPFFPNPKLEAVLLEFADLPVPTPEEIVQRDQAIQDQASQQMQHQMDLAASKQPPTSANQPPQSQGAANA